MLTTFEQDRASLRRNGAFHDPLRRTDGRAPGRPSSIAAPGFRPGGSPGPFPRGFALLHILLLSAGVLLVSWLFFGRFVLLRDRMPNTDLLVRAVSVLGEDRPAVRKRDLP